MSESGRLRELPNERDFMTDMYRLCLLFISLVHSFDYEVIWKILCVFEVSDQSKRCYAEKFGNM